jgi:hypothetical protein
MGKYVYVLFDNNTKAFKIGIADDVEKRKKSIEYASGRKLEIVAKRFVNYPMELEKHLHKINSESTNKKFYISVLIEPEDNNDIDFNLAKLDFLPDIWSPYYKTLDKNKVDYLHKMKIKVIPWTVNNIEDMKSIKEMGCDGLITDFPNFKLPN